MVPCCSVTKFSSCLPLSKSMDCNLCPSLSPWVCSNSCLLSQWCRSISSSSVAPFSCCLLIFPSIRVFSNESTLYIRWPKYWSFNFSSVLSVNIQGWFPLGLTGLISLQTKGLSRVFSSTTIQNYQFFGTQPSLWSNSPISIWLLKKHSFACTDLCRQVVPCSCPSTCWSLDRWLLIDSMSLH